MDKVGLRTLIDVGVELVAARIEALRPDKLDGANTDDDIVTTLDRFTQLGSLLLQHEVLDVWEMLMTGFERILSAGLPEHDDLHGVTKGEAAYQLVVGQRLFALGGLVRLQRRHAFLRSICLIHPNKEYPNYFWSRYLVTMVSRGELEGFHKSAIPQSAEYVRERPELFALYKRDIDTVVNAICQFDFLQCVVGTAISKDIDLCYPNFGTYFNGRTTPAISDLLRDAQLRQIAGVTADTLLAEILRALDEYAAHAFFGINGWHRGYWQDTAILELLKTNPAGRRAT
ncbi:MAG: hypothetical protein WC700_01040 [Gemmatimonadaceae bacterium]|jgi:hypothetical protein